MIKEKKLQDQDSSSLKEEFFTFDQVHGNVEMNHIYYG